MIVLASQSPRRKDLLRKLLGDIPFEAVPSSIDEREIDCPDPAQLVLAEARAKGKDVSQRRKGDVILACDTMVFFQGEKLGKPKDEEDAFRTLRRLQGRQHQILTGYVLLRDGTFLAERVVSSTLSIHPMSDDQIRRYVATKSPLDKAGSYGVQDVEYIESTIVSGEKENIMGLPIKEIGEDFRRLGLLP